MKGALGRRVQQQKQRGALAAVVQVGGGRLVLLAYLHSSCMYQKLSPAFRPRHCKASAADPAASALHMYLGSLQPLTDATPLIRPIF